MRLQCQCQVHGLCFGKELFTSLYMCRYLWRALFQNMISELGISIATSIFRLALDVFLKRTLHVCSIIYYTYRHVENLALLNMPYNLLCEYKYRTTDSVNCRSLHSTESVLHQKPALYRLGYRVHSLKVERAGHVQYIYRWKDRIWKR